MNFISRLVIAYGVVAATSVFAGDLNGTFRGKTPVARRDCTVRVSTDNQTGISVEVRVGDDVISMPTTSDMRQTGAGSFRATAQFDNRGVVPIVGDITTDLIYRDGDLSEVKSVSRTLLIAVPQKQTLRCVKLQRVR